MISPLIAARDARVTARLATGVLLLALSVAASAADSFRVRLRPVPIDPATAASTTGEGSATAVLDGRKLTLTGTFTGLQGAATVANLHQGPATGVRGPSIAEVKVPSSPSGTFTAELTLSASQAEALRQGRVYLQIHSAAAPDGNLWGWLLE